MAYEIQWHWHGTPIKSGILGWPGYSGSICLAFHQFSMVLTVCRRLNGLNASANECFIDCDKTLK